MEIRNSINNQQVNPNFGMALRISKEAKPFIESLSREDRQYLDELGERIKNSRWHINIEEGGKVDTSYTPLISEISIVNDSNRAAYEAERKTHSEKLDALKTNKEKRDSLMEDLKGLAKYAQIQLSPRKSSFRKKVEQAELFQQSGDRYDAMNKVLEERLAQKEAIDKAETENLLSKCGEKEVVKD